MEFRILGPLEVLEDGRSLAIPSGRQRALLVLLVVNANRVLTPERIVDELWGEELPGRGTRGLAFHVAHLRDALAPGRRRGDPTCLATEAGGYVLRVDPEAIDAGRFEGMARRGHDLLADDPAGARGLLVEALALWRGDPLVDVAYAEWAQAEIRRLEELRLTALEDRLDADLALGGHLAAIAELEGLVRENPYRDRIRCLLMLALYRAGRQAEALRAAGDGRRLLAEELGVDPSPELVRLESLILSQDVRLATPTAAAAPARPARNPFKGLRAFGEADAADFHGREALVGRLLGRLEEVLHDGRLLVVVGPSGSGKSSVVRAGLVPALRRGALEGSERWCIATMVPGTAPVRELAAALRSAGLAIPPDVVDRAAGTGDLRPLMETAAPSGASRLLLIVDQLEELYTRVGEEARSTFTAGLLAALAAPDGRLAVVATLRADFFHHPLGSAEVGELVRRGVEIVTPLTRAELDRAIARPAEGVGVAVEPGLVAEIAADVARQPAALPLLQYALTDLFERSDGRHLTRDGYAAIGGATSALARRADEAWEALDGDGREVMRQVLLRLVVPGEGSEDTARRAPRAELTSLADATVVDAVLDDLGRRRLLTFDRDPVTGQPTVEIAHEALLAHWPRLAAWVDEHRRDLWTRRRLADAAAEWEAAGRAPGYLVSGARLDQLAEWSRTTTLRLSGGEQAFLDASMLERRRAERGARTARLRLAGILAAALAVAVGLSALLLRQSQAVGESEDVATAQELAAGSIANLGDRQLSVLLALAAAQATVARGYVVEEAYDALHWALQDAQVAYPADANATAVRQGPDGPRGEAVLPPDELMRMAAANASRSLTAQECRIYLHAADCPPVVAPAADAGRLGVRTAAGTVPVEALATSTVAGTRVRILSELPADLSSLLDGFADDTGIQLAWESGGPGELRARVDGGDLPDVAVVTKPADVAAVARGGWLLDLDRLAVTEGLASDAGTYAMALGSPEGPDRRPHQYGAALAATVDDLLWYSPPAFAAAGYRPPTTPDELQRLVAAVRRDGRMPWCLGTEAGSESGSAAARWVEAELLATAGSEAYDAWVAGDLLFDSVEVKAALQSFGDVALSAGATYGGYASAALTPESIAGLGLLLDPPRCWLDRGTSTDRPHLAGKGLATPAATAFPGGGGPAVLGRLYLVVVLHDRPEVRRAVAALLGDQLAASMAADLGTSGIFPVRATSPPVDPAARLQAARLRSAMDAGTFRVRAAHLFPPGVAAAFLEAVQAYVAGYGDAGPDLLKAAAWAGDAAWYQYRITGR